MFITLWTLPHECLTVDNMSVANVSHSSSTTSMHHSTINFDLLHIAWHAYVMACFLMPPRQDIVSQAYPDGFH